MAELLLLLLLLPCHAQSLIVRRQLFFPGPSGQWHVRYLFQFTYADGASARLTRSFSTPHKLLPAYLKWRLLQVCGNGGLGCEDALMSVPCANFKAPALLGGTAMASGENCPVKEF